MAKVKVEQVLSDATGVVTVWKANPDFNLGALTLADLEGALAALETAQTVVEAKRIEMTGLLDQRDDKALVLSDLVTRARSGFRAVYGPDSPQYEQAGGTRRSERKHPTRQPKG
jgi:hypothetical protein